MEDIIRAAIERAIERSGPSPGGRAMFTVEALGNEVGSKLAKDIVETRGDVRARSAVLFELLPPAPPPIPMRLPCPACGELHIDKGEFAEKPHHTHSCQKCGLTWRPAVPHTVGVQFLPGFKDDP